MTTRKYEFVTDDTILVNGVTLTRIRALIDIPTICQVGELGGYIEKEENLSHTSECWVANQAKVYGDAKVYERAQIYGNARVFGHAFVSGNARVSGCAQVYGDAHVHENARVYGNAQVYEDASISGNTRVFGNAQVYGVAEIHGNTRVYGDARLFGEACVYGDAIISDDAEVSERHHVVWFSNVGTENGTLVVFKTKDGIKVTRGCFTGTPEEFLATSKQAHGPETQEEYMYFIKSAVIRVMRESVKE